MRWGTANPKKEGWYLCTIRDGYSSFVMPLQRVEYLIRNWTWNGLSNGDVIASVSFPKPWNGKKLGECNDD